MLNHQGYINNLLAEVKYKEKLISLYPLNQRFTSLVKWKLGETLVGLILIIGFIIGQDVIKNSELILRGSHFLQFQLSVFATFLKKIKK